MYTVIFGLLEDLLYLMANVFVGVPLMIVFLSFAFLIMLCIPGSRARIKEFFSEKLKEVNCKMKTSYL